MSKGNTFESDLLKLIFKNTDCALVGDATGLRGSSTAGSLYFGIHTADPGEAGDQTTSECAYGSYARVAVTRGAGFTVTGSNVSPAAEVAFPAASSGTETATYFSVGTASSGAGKLLYSGPLAPNIAITTGVTPKITTSTVISED